MKSFSDIQVQELFNILSKTLDETKDIDTQLQVLKGLKDRLGICVNDYFRVLYKNQKVLNGEDDFMDRGKEPPSFFCQDYLQKRDLDSYKVEEIYMSASYFFDDEFVEITENKFAYVFAAILYNEITRCELLKKGKWEGRLHLPPFPLTGEQGHSAWRLLENYDFQDEIASMDDYSAMLRYYDVSYFYKWKRKKKYYAFLNKLARLLGDEWGKIAVPISTSGKKSLEDIRKYYYKKDA
jgi:hypothetical protein